jgi:hypothetical protein
MDWKGIKNFGILPLEDQVQILARVPMAEFYILLRNFTLNLGEIEQLTGRTVP